MGNFFATKDRGETRRYPVIINHISVGDNQGNRVNKIFKQKGRDVFITPEGYISLNYKLKTNIFYDVWISGYINKSNFWDLRNYRQKFYLTEGPSGMVIHSYPFSRPLLEVQGQATDARKPLPPSHFTP